MAHVSPLCYVFWSMMFAASSANEDEYVSKAEFMELRNEMKNLKDAYIDERNELIKLQKRFETLEHDLTNQIAKEKQKNSQLEEKVNQAEKQIKELRNAVKGSDERQIDDPHHNTEENTKHDLNTSVSLMQEQALLSTDEVVPRKRHYRTKLPPRSLFRKDKRLVQHVAFHATGLSDNFNLGQHQTLVFNNVKTNIGNCYHSSTGVFACNVSGVYVFFTTLIAANDNFVRTEIIKDGVQLGVTYAHGTDGHYDTSSTMVITRITSGDSVWVRIVNNNPAGLNLGDPENTFTGFLLYPDE